MPFDSIKPKNQIRPANPNANNLAPNGIAATAKQKTAIKFLVGITTLVIVIFWLVVLRYNFSNISFKKELIPEIERAKEGFSQTMQELNDGVDSLKGNKVYSNPALSPEEIKKLEQRLFEEFPANNEKAATTSKLEE